MWIVKTIEVKLLYTELVKQHSRNDVRWEEVQLKSRFSLGDWSAACPDHVDSREGAASIYWIAGWISLGANHPAHSLVIVLIKLPGLSCKWYIPSNNLQDTMDVILGIQMKEVCDRYMHIWLFVSADVLMMPMLSCGFQLYEACA